MNKEERTRNAKKDLESKRTRIKELVTQDGCPICRACNDAFDREWFWFFSESYGEGSGVSQYINYYGFCEKHTLQVAEKGPIWQRTVIYDWIIKNKLPLFEELLESLPDKASTSTNAISSNLSQRRLKRSIESVKPKGSCLFCDSLEKASEDGLKDLLVVLQDSEMKNLYLKSRGLCMKHFFKALNLVEPQYSAELREIVTAQITKLKELKTNLDEYMRKEDYRFKNDSKGKEQTASTDAIEKFIGDLEAKPTPADETKKKLLNTMVEF